MAVRKMNARFASTCPSCENPIEAGSPILYERRRGAVHDNGTCELPEASGPTTRERKLARAERLEGWADGREAKGEATLAKANQLSDMIPLGQPILVGHHSERRHRRDLDRIHSGMDRGFGDLNKAASMRSRAAGILDAADRAIYSDDPDAIEQLEARLAELEAKRARFVAENAAFRKAHKAELKEMSAYARHQAVPHQAYELSNLTGNIKRNRDRLTQLQREVGPAPADGPGATIEAERVAHGDLLRIEDAVRTVESTIVRDDVVVLFTNSTSAEFAIGEPLEHVGFALTEAQEA